MNYTIYTNLYNVYAEVLEIDSKLVIITVEDGTGKNLNEFRWSYTTFDGSWKDLELYVSDFGWWFI